MAPLRTPWATDEENHCLAFIMQKLCEIHALKFRVDIHILAIQEHSVPLASSAKK